MNPEPVEVFKWINEIALLELVLRFVFNVFFIYIIARVVYFRLGRNRDYMFTLFLFNMLVFFVCYLLTSVNLSLGFAFGIFAIFSLLRYRTTTIPIKEMTYMFISIAIAIINALSTFDLSFAELLFVNATIVIVTIVLEKTWVRNVHSKTILFEKIDLIKPVNRALLLADLKERTGIDVHRVEIGEIDFLRDTAKIKMFYYEDERE